MMEVDVWTIVQFLLGVACLICSIFFLKVSRLRSHGNNTVYMTDKGSDVENYGLQYEHGMAASDDGKRLTPQSKPSASRYDIFG